MSLQNNLANAFLRVSTEMKAHRTLINGNQSDLSALTVSSKTSLVAALNALHAELQSVSGSAAGINDAATSGATTWSSTKITNEVQAAISALVDGAPTALDTLRELADALADADTGIEAITVALDNRVRVDVGQSFTVQQQQQARQNIDAASATEVGDTDIDLVAVFEAGLV